MDPTTTEWESGFRQGERWAQQSANADELLQLSAVVHKAIEENNLMPGTTPGQAARVAGLMEVAGAIAEGASTQAWPTLAAALAPLSPNGRAGFLHGALQSKNEQFLGPA
jgi:hypothetical protein